VSETVDRPVRADARRNYDRLLEVAVHAFATDGEHVTLERIAKTAGVGIGTLYRHFPTRDALVEAAYRHELADLCDAVPGLLQSLPPDEATRAWMDHFIDYMTTKRDMAEALRAVIASGGDPFAESRRRLVGAITALLDAGATAGTLRSDVDANDVLVALHGVSLAAGQPNQRAQAGRLLDLLVQGLRPHATAPARRPRRPSSRSIAAELPAQARADD
jgi:AcrR family transcriptional regulator